MPGSIFLKLFHFLSHVFRVSSVRRRSNVTFSRIRKVLSVRCRCYVILCILTTRSTTRCLGGGEDTSSEVQIDLRGYCLIERRKVLVVMARSKPTFACPHSAVAAVLGVVVVVVRYAYVPLLLCCGGLVFPERIFSDFHTLAAWLSLMRLVWPGQVRFAFALIRRIEEGRRVCPPILLPH